MNSEILPLYPIQQTPNSQDYTQYLFVNYNEKKHNKNKHIKPIKHYYF